MQGEKPKLSTEFWVKFYIETIFCHFPSQRLTLHKSGGVILISGVSLQSPYHISPDLTWEWRHQVVLLCKFELNEYCSQGEEKTILKNSLHGQVEVCLPFGRGPVDSSSDFTVTCGTKSWLHSDLWLAVLTLWFPGISGLPILFPSPSITLMISTPSPSPVIMHYCMCHSHSYLIFVSNHFKKKFNLKILKESFATLPF